MNIYNNLLKKADLFEKMSLLEKKELLKKAYDINTFNDVLSGFYQAKMVIKSELYPLLSSNQQIKGLMDMVLQPLNQNIEGFKLKKSQLLLLLDSVNKAAKSNPALLNGLRNLTAKVNYYITKLTKLQSEPQNEVVLPEDTIYGNETGTEMVLPEDTIYGNEMVLPQDTICGKQSLEQQLSSLIYSAQQKLRQIKKEPDSTARTAQLQFFDVSFLRRISDLCKKLDLKSALPIKGDNTALRKFDLKTKVKNLVEELRPLVHAQKPDMRASENDPIQPIEMWADSYYDLAKL